MSVILGIDTGGTYTDAVIVDTDNNSIICKSKSLTTKHDLCIGISNSIEALDHAKVYEIDEVHLSTTLATNSILENSSYNVGLILIGKDIRSRLLCSEKYVLRSNDYEMHDFAVRDITVLNEIKTLFEHNVDSIVISSYNARKFPLQERQAAHVIQNLFDIPIYCASEITNAPGYKKRTNTCLLNCGLKPIISKWLVSMNNVLKSKDICAPMYIMTGSSRLITTDEAEEFPVETLMSGPASSAAGALYLANKKNALLIDMGGTSADVTKLENGKLRMNKNSTSIHDVDISITSLDIQSFAIGGDSHIFYNQIGTLMVGPRRVIPLCVAASSYPHLIYELETYKKPSNYEMFTAYSTDCYMAGSQSFLAPLTDFERKVVNFIKKKPHSLFFLSEYFNVDPDTLHLSTLTEAGYVQRISFTPTDLLHITGKYTQWEPMISHTAAKIMCRLGRYELDDFITKCEALIINKLAFSCMQSVANFEKLEFDFRKSEGSMYLIDKYLNDLNPYLSAVFNITKPLIAVGAPSGSWMQSVADKLGTSLILSDHYEVANAIGAAISAYEKNTEGFQ